MSNYCVELQNNTLRQGDLIYKASDFGDTDNIKFAKNGKVEGFSFHGIDYISVYEFSTRRFIDYVQKEKFDDLVTSEKKKTGVNYNGIDVSVWRSSKTPSLDITFKLYESLTEGIVNDLIYGLLRDESGTCFNYYIWEYANPYKGPVNPTKAPGVGDCIMPEDFSSSQVAQSFFTYFKNRPLFDASSGTTQVADARLIGDIASLMKKVNSQMIVAFQGFTAAGVDVGNFVFSQNTSGSYSKDELLDYKNGLEHWLQIYADYQVQLQALNHPGGNEKLDSEKLYIICDNLYRYNMLGALTNAQRIQILSVLCYDDLRDWYFASFKNGVQYRETLAVRIIKSVPSTQQDATDFLDLLSQPRFPNYGDNTALYKLLFYKIDDFFGADNFTAYANQINRLVLAKNNITQTKDGYIIDSAVTLQQLVKYNYIYSDRSSNDFKGQVTYTFTNPSDTTIRVEEHVCAEIKYYYSYDTLGTRQGSAVGICIQDVNPPTAPVELLFSDLISVHYLTNPSFLDVCEYGNCLNASFLASAGYIDYLNEKKSTKLKLDILSKSLQLLSLAFGAGELLLAIRTAEVVRAVVGAYVLVGDIYSAVINSQSFIDYLQTAYPDSWQDIKDTLDMIALIHGVTATGISLGYGAYKLNQATKFVGEIDALKLNPAAIGRMTAGEVNALHAARERVLAELYVLRKNTATKEIIDDEIKVYRDVRNLQIPDAIRGTTEEWNAAKTTIADYRSSITGAAGNYGYIQGTINGSTVAFVDPQTGVSIWRSVSAAIAQQEHHIFDSSVVIWNRITDSEYRMLNNLASSLVPNAEIGDIFTEFLGTIRVVSEIPYCTSCAGAIKQFNQMFPNIKIILIDGVRLN